MTKPTTRYVRTICNSVVQMYRNNPTTENYMRATALLGKIRSAYIYDITRTGKRVIDEAISEIEDAMKERRHK